MLVEKSVKTGGVENRLYTLKFLNMKQPLLDALSISHKFLGPSYCTYHCITEQVTHVVHRGVWDSIRAETLTWPQFRVLVQATVKESIQSE